MAAVLVVVPVYDSGPLLERALRSVVAQTTSDWTCAVVDDGGSEDLTWVDDYHPSVRRHRQPNAGVSTARNAALLHDDAPLVAYLDQDDVWLPDKLRLQVQALDGADLSYTQFVWVHPDGRNTFNDAPLIDYRQFLREGHLCLSSLVVRRSALLRVGGFDPLLRVQQDYDLVLRLLRAGARPAPVAQVLTRYQLHERNVSSDYQRALSERLHVLSAHGRDAEGRGDREVVAAAEEGMRVTRRLYGRQAFTAFRAQRHATDLVRAARLNPTATARDLVRAALTRRPGG